MGLGRYDLENTIDPVVSIDEFVSKAGTNAEVVVVGFHVMDNDPAKDLNTFIQRGPFEILDCDVSPNPDDDGKYMVFVEFPRSPHFRTMFPSFLRDIENVAGHLKWKIKHYLADELYTLDESIWDKIPLEVNFVQDDDSDTDEKVDSLREHFPNLIKRDNSRIEFRRNELSLIGNFVDFDHSDVMLEKYDATRQAHVPKSQIDDRFIQETLGSDWNFTYKDNTIIAEHIELDKILYLESSSIYIPLKRQ